MSKFIVSARKYRPATFASVVGQSHITSTLQNAISREQLAHAYLFCGPRGVGKTTCARIVAKAINCMNRTPQNEACNKCDSCITFDSGTSFNIHELDAASNTSVENIRSLNEQVRILPTIGKYSVYIIDEVHMLSTSAFNAFLKTLEEPPAHVIFILATTEKHKILPTILSRCQTYEFKRIRIEDVVKYLQHISLNESIEYDDESLHLIASKADGCMRDALSMYDKVVSFCGNNLTATEVSLALNILDYETYFGFCSLLKGGNYQDSLLKYDDILQRGFDSHSFISGLSSHLRNILIARNDNTAKLLEVTGNIAQRYKQQSSELDLGFIFKSLEILTSLESTLKTTLNQRLACEFAILKLCNITGEILSYTPTIAPALPQTTQQPAQQQVAPQTPLEPAKTAQVSSEVNVVEQPILNATPTDVSDALSKQTAPIVEVPISEANAPTVKAESKSRIRQGSMSIKDLKQALNNGETVQSEQPEEEEIFELINSENEDKVITACYEYAQKIKETKTRISLVLSRAKITNNKISLLVPSSILEDEIIKQKHDLLSEIKKLCNIGGLDFDIAIDDSDEMIEKKIYVKSEDKLIFLKSKNATLQHFIKDLDLHMI